MALYETTKFGILEPEPEDLLTLPWGLLDHPELTEFARLEDEIGHPFFWLQSLQQKDFALTMIDSPDLSTMELIESFNWKKVFEQYRVGKWPFHSVGSALTLVRIPNSVLDSTVDLSCPIITDGDDQQLAVQIHIEGARSALRVFPADGDPEYASRDPTPYEGDNDERD